MEPNPGNAAHARRVTFARHIQREASLPALGLHALLQLVSFCQPNPVIP